VIVHFSPLSTNWFIFPPCLHCHTNRPPPQVQYSKEVFLVLGDLEDFPEASNLASGWRREKGDTERLKLFMRSHLADLRASVESFLAQTKKKHLYITGPPGSGKTTFFLSFFTHWARQHKKNGLVVQYRHSARCEIIFLNGDKNAQVLKRDDGTNLSSANLLDTVNSVVPREKGLEFVIFDGVRQSLDVCSNILGVINANFEDAVKVHITSLAFYIPGGDGSAGDHGPDQYLDVNSWLLEDYKECAKSELYSLAEWKTILASRSDDDDDDVADSGEGESDSSNAAQETLEEVLVSLIERKYFYAGGSARLFFDYSLETLLTAELEKMESRVTEEEWANFTTLQIGSRTHNNVSSILQKIGKAVLPVSKYFALAGYKRQKEKLVKALATAADVSENPAIRGWAFELEQYHIVRDHVENRLSFVSSKDQKLCIPIGEETVDFECSSLKGDTSKSKFLILCTKWNQGCFDMAFVFDPIWHGCLIRQHSTKARSLGLKNIH